MDLKEADILGEYIPEHWYYRTKSAAMKKFVADLGTVSILDVGAGSAFFSRALLECTAATEAWCVDISYTAEHEGQCNGKPIHSRRSRSEEHTSELQSRENLVCRLLLE